VLHKCGECRGDPRSHIVVGAGYLSDQAFQLLAYKVVRILIGFVVARGERGRQVLLSAYRFTP
jgi:hypothetical protein